MKSVDLLLVGPGGNTHIASSFFRAASDLGISAELIDTGPAYTGPAFLRKIAWHIGGRRPIYLKKFSSDILNIAQRRYPLMLITVGQAPVRSDVLKQLRKLGVKCVNFSTDNPFNLALRARWHLSDLAEYDIVYTPRHANIEDLQRQGCQDVRYLRFGFDDTLFSCAQIGKAIVRSMENRVLFVGGADTDRYEFFKEFSSHGFPVDLVGGYWDRFSIPNARVLGTKSYKEIAELSVDAAVNICLVRRANCDGHVMRTFEIPAVGGFMLAEDTDDHRMLFGEEGKFVLYFRSPREAAIKVGWAFKHPEERRAMAKAANEMIWGSQHTYRHRLQAILSDRVRPNKKLIV